ncbi:YgfZ/GcvT domain-containing protein [Microbacterium sp. YY-01]|uniref:CAF17-like 4Fe-4S cluster assembly/insertion protein YgfZ n=1 Tax=Microbacterium sp. YY-01 TaxID=3421634 RepID=UPI003D185ECB
MTLFSSVAGAVPADQAISHFGNPMPEQRMLSQGRALVPLEDRAVIELTGPERLTWLDSITSQAVAHLPAFTGTELLVLDPQGRVEHAAAVIDDGASTWLMADADDAEPLATWLRRMIFRAQVKLALRDDIVALGYVPGAEAEEIARENALQTNEQPVVWHDPWHTVTPGGHQYYAGDQHPGVDYHWHVALVSDDTARALALRDDIAWAGVLAAEALRVAAWRPRWATEVDERSIPHESDWIRSAVHMSKGCYRGQETVAKVHNLGHPPRRLAALHLDGSDTVLPARGDVVIAGEKEVGHITSAVRHWQEGPIALAVLSRRAPVDDLIVRTAEGEVSAAQEVIVPADAGATANVPRLTRLSRRKEAADPRRAASEE